MLYKCYIHVDWMGSKCFSVATVKYSFIFRRKRF